MTPRKPKRPPVDEPPSWVQRGEPSPNERADPDLLEKLRKQHEALLAQSRARGEKP